MPLWSSSTSVSSSPPQTPSIYDSIVSSDPRNPHGLTRREPPRSGDVVAPGQHRTRPQPERDDGPSADDLERFGDVTRICPDCKKDVFDDAAVCYHCGYAFERKDERKGPGMFTIVVVALLLLTALLWGARVF